MFRTIGKAIAFPFFVVICLIWAVIVGVNEMLEICDGYWKC